MTQPTLAAPTIDTLPAELVVNVLRFVPPLFRMRSASLVAKRWRQCFLLSVDRFPFAGHVSSDAQERSFGLFSRLTTLALSVEAGESPLQETRLPTTLQRLQLRGDVFINCEDDDAAAPPVLGKLTSLRACAPDQHSHRPFFEKYASRLLELELTPDAWGTTWRWPLPSLTRLVVQSVSDVDPEEVAALLALSPALRSLDLRNICLDRAWKYSRNPCPVALTALSQLKIYTGEEDNVGDNLALHYLLPAVPAACHVEMGCVVPLQELAAVQVTEIRLIKAKHLGECSHLRQLSLHKDTRVKDVAELTGYAQLLASLDSLTATGSLAVTWPRLTQLRALTVDSFPEDFSAPAFPRLRHLTIIVESYSSPRTALFQASLSSLVSASVALETVTLICPGHSAASIIGFLKIAAEREVPHLVCHIPHHIRDARALRDALRKFPVTLQILPLRAAS